ncbi:MAG: four helix bundle protein [Gemmataceae bacterium]
MPDKIQTHRDLQVYQKAFAAAVTLFEFSKRFPKEEIYSLTDQIRRSSRSVCANLAEAWRRRRYKAAFISKLCDTEGEAAETQVWIEFAVKFGYLNNDQTAPLYQVYDKVLRMIVAIISRPDPWLLA